MGAGKPRWIEKSIYGHNLDFKNFIQDTTSFFAMVSVLVITFYLRVLISSMIYMYILLTSITPFILLPPTPNTEWHGSSLQ